MNLVKDWDSFLCLVNGRINWRDLLDECPCDDEYSFACRILNSVVHWIVIDTFSFTWIIFVNPFEVMLLQLNPLQPWYIVSLLVQDFILWFFRFTFASNTATILHGTLVGEPRKLRMIALFIYAFLVSAFIHPVTARFLWSPVGPFSPYR